MAYRAAVVQGAQRRRASDGGRAWRVGPKLLALLVLCGPAPLFAAADLSLSLSALGGVKQRERPRLHPRDHEPGPGHRGRRHRGRCDAGGLDVRLEHRRLHHTLPVHAVGHGPGPDPHHHREVQRPRDLFRGRPHREHGHGQLRIHHDLVPGNNTATASTAIIRVQGFYTLPPCRLADTRGATGVPIGGPALTAGQVRTFNVRELCGLPGQRDRDLLQPDDHRSHRGGRPAPLSREARRARASVINYVSGPDPRQQRDRAPGRATARLACSAIRPRARPT